MVLENGRRSGLWAARGWQSLAANPRRNSWRSRTPTEAIQRISLKNREYAYIEDANRGVVLVEIGPKVLTLEAHLTLVTKSRMIELGTGNWCVVRNPVVREGGKVALDEFGQARIAVGDREVRVGPQVFPLYPGEEMEGEITPEHVLGVYDALRLQALNAFMDERAPGGPRRREAGDEWLVRGPGRYVPNAAVVVVSAEKARMLKETEYCVVLNPVDRTTGKIQEGRRKIISGPDVFFLEPGEALEGDVRRKHVLSEMQGLKLQALDDFSEPDEGGESRARKAGDTWIVRGPRTYVPNERVLIHKEIVALSLGQGEGLYVRDLRSGKVSLVQGPCQFMPEAHQELHEKRLSAEAEALLGLAPPPPAPQLAAVDGKDPKAPRSAAPSPERIDRTRAIVLRIEDNTAVLINDFETNHARVEFGPAKVMLRPYEDVTVLDLSGSTPKRPRQLKVLMLRLGPDFATDLFEVATRDHARLRIKLSYKWQFDVEGDSEKDKAIFRVNDFIGYVCENLASRIRQVAAENDFETFHKNASVLIRRAIFGVDEAGKARKDRACTTRPGERARRASRRHQERVQRARRRAARGRHDDGARLAGRAARGAARAGFEPGTQVAWTIPADAVILHRRDRPSRGEHENPVQGVIAEFIPLGAQANLSIHVNGRPDMALHTTLTMHVAMRNRLAKGEPVGVSLLASGIHVMPWQDVPEELPADPSAGTAPVALRTRRTRRTPARRTRARRATPPRPRR